MPYTLSTPEQQEINNVLEVLLWDCHDSEQHLCFVRVLVVCGIPVRSCARLFRTSLPDPCQTHACEAATRYQYISF